jgi:hypothetical protein
MRGSVGAKSWKGVCVKAAAKIIDAPALEGGEPVANWRKINRNMNDHNFIDALEMG